MFMLGRTYNAVAFGFTMAMVFFKLEGAIDWSWWLVTALIWGPWVACGTLFVIGAGIVGLLALWETQSRKTPRR